MRADSLDDPQLYSLPHPDDESVLAAARDALITGASNVFIVGEEEFHIDACFLALYQQLKREPGLQLHRMMSPKVDDIVELFNTVLADLSIDEARNHQAQERHIIVMPDFGPNAGKEWMACESLVNTFPGANVGLLAFSTLDNHDASALQQLSLKARNKLMRLATMDQQAMERYLTECHDRGALTELLPALADSPWYELGITILGLTTSEAPKQSVSDYDDLMSKPPDETPEEPPHPSIAKDKGDEPAPASKVSRINWGALFARLTSLFIASLIALLSFSLVIAVAGALHPPIWSATEALITPWLDTLMGWLDRLLGYLPR